MLQHGFKELKMVVIDTKDEKAIDDDILVNSYMV